MTQPTVCAAHKSRSGYLIVKVCSALQLGVIGSVSSLGTHRSGLSSPCFCPYWVSSFSPAKWVKGHTQYGLVLFSLETRGERQGQGYPWIEGLLKGVQVPPPSPMVSLSVVSLPVTGKGNIVPNGKFQK